MSEKLANASETNKKINEACEEYRPVAHRATLVYFLIAEFTVVNCMYQTSLAQFNTLYELSIDRSERATMPSKRIHNIIEFLTYEIYLYIQRGLFERHKIIFALMLTNKILLSAGKVRERCAFAGPVSHSRHPHGCSQDQGCTTSCCTQWSEEQWSLLTPATHACGWYLCTTSPATSACVKMCKEVQLFKCCT